MFLRYCFTSDLTWAGKVSSGGKIRSSKLSAREYFKFVLKNKLSLIINSVSFSTSKAPLKNSSLDAKKGLNRIFVFVTILLVCGLS